MALLTATKSPSFLQRVRSSPGGFVWWYVDITAPTGESLVLIWSEGLPFLAGSREAQLCGERPSVCLALYERTACVWYSLEEIQESQLNEQGSGRMGRNLFTVTQNQEESSLHAVLDLMIPGSSERLRGEVRLRGKRVQRLPSEQDLPSDFSPAQHIWEPHVVQGQAEAEIQTLSGTWKIQGSGYWDGNASTQPLSDQGIASWRWGRVHFPDRALLFYDVEMESGERNLSLSWANPEGEFQPFSGELSLADFKRARYGIRSPRTLHLSQETETLEIHARALVDDGPFYQRFLVDALDARGQEGRGVYEVVLPPALDIAWQRPFVRMRTSQVRRPNSLWLPLFSGSPQDRWQRLLRSWGERMRGERA